MEYFLIFEESTKNILFYPLSLSPLVYFNILRALLFVIKDKIKKNLDIVQRINRKFNYRNCTLRFIYPAMGNEHLSEDISFIKVAISDKRILKEEIVPNNMLLIFLLNKLGFKTNQILQSSLLSLDKDLLWDIERPFGVPLGDLAPGEYILQLSGKQYTLGLTPIEIKTPETKH